MNYAAITENDAAHWVLFGISDTVEGARSTVPPGWLAQAEDQPDRFQIVPCTLTLANAFAADPAADGWDSDDDLLWCLDGQVATLAPRPTAGQGPSVYLPGTTITNPHYSE